MSTVHSYNHADGTTSTRVSQSPRYTHGIEAVTNARLLSEKLRATNNPGAHAHADRLDAGPKVAYSIASWAGNESLAQAEHARITHASTRNYGDAITHRIVPLDVKEGKQ